MRAIVYTRVSSDPHGIGRSVEDQETECRHVCEREGWKLVRVLVDNDRSASRHARKTRPAYAQLMTAVADGDCDVVVTWEASRAQRDLDAYLKLRAACEKSGVLWSYSGRTYDFGRSDDRFTTGLDALLAERESDVTRERIMRSVRSNAEQGRPHGKIPYGYRRLYDPTSGALVEQVIHDEQAAVIREINRRAVAGESIHVIADDLNARGVPAPRGGRWEPTQVKRLATNPTYIGKRTYKGQVVGDATWPAIIDDTTHHQNVVRLTDPARRNNRETRVKYLLTGIAVCGECDGRVVAMPMRGKYMTYTCRASFCIGRKVEHLDAYVTRAVVERLRTLPLADGADPASRSALLEAAEKRARLQGFYDAAARGEISPAGLARVEAGLLPEIADAERRAHRQLVPPVLRDAVGVHAAAVWEGLEVAQRREIIRALADIRIMRTGRGRRTFDPASVELTWR